MRDKFWYTQTRKAASNKKTKRSSEKNKDTASQDRVPATLAQRNAQNVPGPSMLGMPPRRHGFSEQTLLAVPPPPPHHKGGDGST